MRCARERAELEAVLASTLFSRAPVLSRFLSYVCEQHFKGLSGGIKEYNIAVEALGRGPDFNSAEDSIVRVQAARLRQHLRKYYETDGVGHSLHIRISPAGYAPQFVEVTETSTSQPPESTTVPLIEASSQSSEPAPEPSELAPDVSHLVRRGSSSTRRVFLAAAVVFPMAAVLVLRPFWKTSSANGDFNPAPNLPTAAEAGAAVRIKAGFMGPRFVDTGGEIWLGDRNYKGGSITEKPGHPIYRTFDQALYQTAREGDFSYAIPLKKGIYELHLHFAETTYGHGPTIGAETQRVFNVAMNGKPLLRGFDITKDAAGSNTAVEKIFIDASPGEDGLLRLDFSTARGSALLNGIEIIPGIPGKMRPLRIVCSNRPYYDLNGRLWIADQYFAGGRLSELIRPIIGSEDPGLYSSYRTGNFTYAIPVARGRTYRVRMQFTEPVWGGSNSTVSPENRRVFDIYCNGKALIEGLDVYKETGARDRLVVKTFKGLKPNAQGKLNFSFIPTRDYAVLLALEVLDEEL